MPYKDKTSPVALASLRAARRKHYYANVDVYKARARERTKRIRMLVREARMKPCADCRRRLPWYVMDFDHRPGEVKIADVADLAKNSAAEARILAEIEKCDVVCAVCHRVRTYERAVAARGLKDVEEDPFMGL